MRTVQRHEIDVEFAARQAEELHDTVVNWALIDLDKAPAQMNEVQYLTRSVWGYRLAGDAPAALAETWRSTVLAMQAGTAAFQAATRPAGTVVECRFGTETLPVRSEGPSFWTTGGEWLNACYLALVCREKERLDFLNSVSPDFLRDSAAGGSAAPYLYPWIQALQALWRGEEDCQEHLYAAVEAIDPQGGRDRANLIAFPAMRVFEAVIAEDGAAFNDALFEGLEWHREHWTRDAERRRSPEGFVALPLLALACLATDLGIPVEVESEYLPGHLVKGEWVGEFPT
ncbi:immunity 49 family protein [Actinomadura kijaniata]|uniref:immunity 49 family protein n=1 Tax=Actinomadura kijaniata TaxID=46161 RepID=UPI003F1A2602